MIDHTKLNDLREHEFSKTFRGYSPKEVDEFVESLLYQAGELVDDFQGLERRVRELESEREEIRKREDLLSATLVAAQSTADEWKILARKESDQIIREAHGEVDELLRVARQEAEDLLRKAREKWRMEEEERSRARQDLSLNIARMKGEFLALKESLERWESLAVEFGGNPNGPEEEVH